MHQVQDLRLTTSNIIKPGGIHYLRSLLTSGMACPLLETLSLTLNQALAELFEPPEVPLLSFFCQDRSPRLHTLLVARYRGWTKGSLCNLRHLCIGHQSFDTDHFARLFDVLEANAGLKDLVLFEVEAVEGVGQDNILQLRKVDTHKLERLIIKNCTCNVYRIAEAFLTLSEGSARQYTFDENPWLLDRWQGTSAEQLFISPRQLICAKATSAICFRGTKSTLPPLLLDITGPVVELSVQGGVDGMDIQWNHVVTLTLGKGSDKMLRSMYKDPPAAPSLVEVRVHNPSSAMGKPLLKFLGYRKSIGKPVQRLRITQSSRPDSTADDAACTFEGWQRGGWKFKRLVPDVSFETVFGSVPVLELPQICLQEPTAHTFWDHDLWEGHLDVGLEI